MSHAVGILLGVSIRAPRAGGDQNSGRARAPFSRVSIRAPARGAMGSLSESPVCCSGFNPRPPRGGRFFVSDHRDHARRFNPRPPRAGGDVRETEEVPSIVVSIRAPRAGGDINFNYHTYGTGVSIRAPRAGGDYTRLGLLVVEMVFQSAPPARGAIAERPEPVRLAAVSIRAPRAGGDPW